MLRLEQLLEKAAASAIYRDWDLGQVQAFGDPAWQRLPTLERDALRGQPPPPPDNRGDILYISSGTVGRPKLVRYDREDLDRIATLCARFGALEGIKAGTRIMVLLPMALWSVGRITIAGHRRLGATVFPVDLHGGVTSWQRIADQIHPEVISSTPSVLAAWAPHYTGPPMTLIETTGEPLLISEQQRIEAAFGGQVHDAYGLSECVVGVECSERDGLHYWPDATGVEVLATESDQPLAPRTIGELVLTNLQQASLPILRYRSGDLGELITTPCRCDHPTPRIRLHGRRRPSLELPRGVQLETRLLDETLAELGVSARIRYKASPESPVAPHLPGSFVLRLEVDYDSPQPQIAIRDRLLKAIPELAELCFEGELLLEVVTKDGKGRKPNE